MTIHTAGDTARTPGTSPELTEEATGALADRVFGSVLGALDVLTIHVGDQLGLYDLLHRRGPLDVAEVAARPASTPATPASGSSNRPSPAWSTWSTPTVAADERRYSAMPTRTPPCSATATAWPT